MRGRAVAARLVPGALVAVALAACAERSALPMRIVPVPYQGEPAAPVATPMPTPVPTPAAVVPPPAPVVEPVRTPVAPSAVATAAPAATPAAVAPATSPSGEPLAPVTPLPTASGHLRGSVLHELCHQQGSGGVIEASRRALAETFCGATLWLDSLFGGVPDVGNARAVSGRVELYGIHSDYGGMDYAQRVHLNYDLPNLERRVRLFLGRDDQDFVADRQQTFAVRDNFGLMGGGDWLAGLGYSPPGHLSNHLDFQVGGRLSRAPEVFLQARYRYNIWQGEHSVWRLRETWFWENRDKFGVTSSADYAHVLRPDLLVRWWNIATWSQATKGVEWRDSLMLYKNLLASRAVAAELFVRGATDAPVTLREYGSRVIYRQPLGREYLFGDFIVGYTWPRETIEQTRKGSAMLGFGVELLWGGEPF